MAPAANAGRREIVRLDGSGATSWLRTRRIEDVGPGTRRPKALVV